MSPVGLELLGGKPDSVLDLLGLRAEVLDVCVGDVRDFFKE